MCARSNCILARDMSPIPVDLAQRVVALEKLSAQNHNLFGTGSSTRDALILIRGEGGNRGVVGFREKEGGGCLTR